MSTRRRLAVVVVLGAAPLLGASPTADAPSDLLLRKPTVRATEIAFSYGGDLWVAARRGGEARRLTAGVDIETARSSPPTASGSPSPASTRATRTSTSFRSRAEAPVA